MDKLTIEPKINTILGGTEHLLRGLNSLQELLHHNVDQYLMVSPTKFVSFDEYVIPAILILLPLMLRVLIILFSKGDEDNGTKNKDESSIHSTNCKESCFRFRSLKGIGGALFLMIVLLLINQALDVYGNNGDSLPEGDGEKRMGTIINFAFCILYVLMLQYTLGSKTTTNSATIQKLNNQDRGDEKQSLQILACLLALYIHVPIVLVHISLGLISAMVWVPLLAFPSYKKQEQRRLQFISTFLSRTAIILMVPPIAKNVFLRTLSLIMGNISSNKGAEAAGSVAIDVVAAIREINPLSSTYICCVYVPLHFMLLLISFS